jgi:hypothetical protein
MISISHINETFSCRRLNIPPISWSQGNLHANKPINPIMKKYIITGIMAAIAATSVMAGTPVASKEVVEVAPPCLFRDNELQLDLFGLGDFYKGANGNFVGNYAPLFGGAPFESRQLSGRPAWGGGVGLNYIFAKYFGVGIEQSVFGRNSNSNTPTENYDPFNYGYTRWQTTGNFILRYPICQWNLAPYLLIGGGAQYGNVPNINAGTLPNGQTVRYRMAGQGFGHVGGGLEYRVTQNIGLFTDLRYLFSGVDGLANNQMQWRYGLRFAF